MAEGGDNAVFSYDRVEAPGDRDADRASAP